MKNTKLPRRSFRPYRLHEMNERQTDSGLWFQSGDDDRSSESDLSYVSSKADSWPRPEFPARQAEHAGDHPFDCLAKSIEIEQVLSSTAYPLNDVQCHVEQHQLVLSGRVLRYYYVQLVLSLVQRYCAGRKIINEIEVLPLISD